MVIREKRKCGAPVKGPDEGKTGRGEKKRALESRVGGGGGGARAVRENLSCLGIHCTPLAKEIETPANEEQMRAHVPAQHRYDKETVT